MKKAVYTELGYSTVNVKLEKCKKKQHINGTNLRGMHTEQMTKALRFKRG